MPFLSFLTILPVLGFVYTICFIAREERTKLSNGVGPAAIPSPNFPAIQVPFRGKRYIKWISAKEFQTLSCRSDDLVLIALRKKAEAKPISFPESHVLYIEPEQLIDLLRWLPSSCGAILYGTFSCLSASVWTVRNLTGSAPIYVVCETPLHSDGLP
jgi:hypothetical protein